MTADQPIPRYGEPEEVTKVLLFLAADATFRTGSEWVIDGGAVLGPVVPLPEEQPLVREGRLQRSRLSLLKIRVDGYRVRRLERPTGSRSR